MAFCAPAGAVGCSFPSFFLRVFQKVRVEIQGKCPKRYRGEFISCFITRIQPLQESGCEWGIESPVEVDHFRVGRFSRRYCVSHDAANQAPTAKKIAAKARIQFSRAFSCSFSVGAAGSISQAGAVSEIGALP
jgi:hypothetical protein